MIRHPLRSYTRLVQILGLSHAMLVIKYLDSLSSGLKDTIALQRIHKFWSVPSSAYEHLEIGHCESLSTLVF